MSDFTVMFPTRSRDEIEEVLWRNKGAIQASIDDLLEKEEREKKVDLIMHETSIRVYSDSHSILFQFVVVCPCVLDCLISPLISRWRGKWLLVCEWAVRGWGQMSQSEGREWGGLEHSLLPHSPTKNEWDFIGIMGQKCALQDYFDRIFNLKF